MRMEIGYLQTCSALILVLATFMAREVDSRLPPKLLKVAAGASKALYARGYGYSVIPIPQKILLQTSLARREVHHPRPVRRAKRPRRGKRPYPSYAPKYQDYRPIRKRRPPPPYNHDYVEQESDEEFEYDDRPYREFEEFVAKPSEHYPEAYRAKPPRGRYKEEEGPYSEGSGLVYSRRPRPSRSGRPSSKLYSAAIPSRYQREESDYDEEEEEEYDFNRASYGGRGRYRPQEDEEDGYVRRERYRDWGPDDVYHDRTYQTKDKFRRDAGDKIKTGYSLQPLQERTKKNKLLLDPDRLRWTSANDRNKWKNSSNSKREEIQTEKNRWKSFLEYEEQNKWKTRSAEPTRSESSQVSVDPIQMEPFRLEDHSGWRAPLGIGKLYQKEFKNSEREEPEIITKQNAGKWEERQSGAKQERPAKEESDGWVKEHSVGYDIEIEGGGRKKKVEPQEGDVVYGQSGYSKPRVPDLGYGQGMEVVRPLGWEVYLR